MIELKVYIPTTEQNPSTSGSNSEITRNSSRAPLEYLNTDTQFQARQLPHIPHPPWFSLSPQKRRALSPPFAI